MDYCGSIKDRCFHCCAGECQFRYEFLEKPERKAILKDAVNVFGIAHQTQKAIEEMSELMKALTKPGTPTQVIQEELVDVQIMIEQLKDMYGWNEQIEQQKLIRLRGLIADEESRSNVESDDAASQTERSETSHR